VRDIDVVAASTNDGRDEKRFPEWLGHADTVTVAPANVGAPSTRRPQRPLTVGNVGAICAVR
jgi:hypothetical protein